MTEFPELQQALVDAAHRRYAPRRRVWRVLRVAVPAAAVVALIAVLTGDRPSDERPATPSPTPVATLEPTDALSRNYEVFRRPPTAADELPVREPSIPPDEPRTTIDADRVRLLFERGDLRVYAVAATRGEDPRVCVLPFVGDAQEEGRCHPVLENPALGGTVTFVPVLVDGAPAIAALAADDVPAVEVEFADGRVERHEFVDSAVLAPADPWPSALEWRNGAGVVVGADLTSLVPPGS